jgi:hypothetical protein
MLVTPEDACDQTISLETQADMAIDTVGVALQENYGSFVRYMKFLALEDQELINLYYQVEKPQWCLAMFHRSTQTLCSQRLKLAVKRLALMAMFQGHPELEVLDAILEEHGLNQMIPGGPTTGALVVEYRKHHSFTAVTDLLRCSRPQARRALIASAAALLKDEHEEHTAFGAYIHGMIDQASVMGSGYSENKRLKCAHGFVTHPTIVGQARIRIEDLQDYDHILVSRASL